MSDQTFHRSERGQIAVLLAVAMIGLLGLVGLTLDGAMLFWNQRRAQNGADAAATAGVAALSAQVVAKNYSCATSSEDPILTVVYKYAANNEVPDADSGNNVTAFYLVQNTSGDWVDLINPSTGTAWQVGATGHIPCAKVRGLRVRTDFPQRTFLAGVIGIAETRATVEASAIYQYNTWCTEFAVIALSTACDHNILGLSGSDIALEGGAHSNGGMQISGGGQGIYLEPGMPVEYGGTCSAQLPTDDKIIGGPEPDAVGKGIEPYESDGYISLDGDNLGYKFEDFAKDGDIYNDLPADHRFDFGNRNITTSDVRKPDGSLRDGLYVTRGSIKLSRLSNAGEAPWQVTLVAMGSVEISGGFWQVPMTHNVFIFTLSNDLSSGAVNLSGDGNHWEGLILAPYGKVSASAAKNSDLGGMIVGYEVDLSGSNIEIRRNQAYCPVNPPRVLLIK
jgi:Flp pilus assembly protein TadG